MNPIIRRDFTAIKERLYDKCNFSYTTPTEEEGSAYGAALFRLNDLTVRMRTAKITPKKIGQFVTLWKRNKEGKTEPYHISDPFDLCVINVRKNTLFGHFVFPKTILAKHRIVSTEQSQGKRGIRIYPPWSNPTSKQAQKTQKWQSAYFIPISKESGTNFTHAKKLYAKKRNS